MTLRHQPSALRVHQAPDPGTTLLVLDCSCGWRTMQHSWAAATNLWADHAVTAATPTTLDWEHWWEDQVTACPLCGWLPCAAHHTLEAAAWRALHRPAP